MDQHLHPQQWHPRPIQSTLCPICSTSHFPFCPPPPPPSFNQNPNSPYPPDFSFQRPNFDPYRSSIELPPRPYMGNFNDGFVDQRPWNGNPYQSHGENFLHTPPYDYGSNGFVNDAERSFKRPRVDDGSSASVLNERRLKLIREHGGGSSSVLEGSSNVEMNHFQDQNIGVNDGRGMGSYKEFSHSRYGQFGSSDGNYFTERNDLHYSEWMDHRNNTNSNIHDRDFRRSPIHMRQFSLHGHQNLEGNNHHGTQNSSSGGGRFMENGSSIDDSRLFNEQPPLPASPPPPLPWDSHLQASGESKAYSSQAKSSSLFPVNISAITSSTYSPVPEIYSTKSYHHNNPISRVCSSSIIEDSQAVYPSFSKNFAAEGQPFGLKQLSSYKPKIVDASQLFKRPHRSTRPGHVVVILRGLPGSGKSYWAKMLRDVEVDNGGDAPRIHSMDDYFMAEVEKVEQGEANSSNSVKGKKPIVKKVMEYCYEPEMEEAYRSSMLKAFRKTVEEGVFTFVIVDDRNLRVADFAQFWAIAKSSGYEVYILEATYRDPAGCAARNVHGFTLGDIQVMARQWEEAPPLYLQLDIKSLCHVDDLKNSGIQEVDMDMEDEDDDGGLSSLQEMKSEKIVLPPLRSNAPEDDGKEWDAEPDHLREEVKELGRSKWSNDLDDDEMERTALLKGNANALSALIKDYARRGKSVHWIDQVGHKGFLIGAAKTANRLSLVIGPGAGYNLKSNPLPGDNSLASTYGGSESKRHSKFEERLRAESESFKVVFDKRRQRIGLDWEEE